jgi:chromosome segregation ATPase
MGNLDDELTTTGLDECRVILPPAPRHQCHTMAAADIDASAGWQAVAGKRMQTIDALNRMLGTVHEQLTVTQHQRDEAVMQRQAAEAELQELKWDIVSLVKLNDSIDKKFEWEHTALSAKRSEADNMRNELAEMAHRLSDLQAHLNNETALANQCIAERDEALRRLHEAETELTESRTVQGELLRELDTARAEATQNLSLLNDVSVKHLAAQQTADQLQTELDTLRTAARQALLQLQLLDPDDIAPPDADFWIDARAAATALGAALAEVEHAGHQTD